MSKLPRLYCDFESRSACNLKKSGTWVYSQHPSTEVLCLVYRISTWEPGRTEVWHPDICGMPEHFDADSLGEMFEWIASGGLVECHNSWFEYCLWHHILVERFGWPEIPMRQFRCSASQAAAHALPRGLDDAGKALKLPIRKDAEGSKVMMKMTKPRKSRKAERALWLKGGTAPPKYLWWESPELLARLIEYCKQDVLAEEAVSHALPDLSAAETELFLLDLAINARGFQLDMPAVRMALRLIHREGVLLNQELTLLTGRKVRKATQRAKMLEWFASEGLVLENLQKGTVALCLSSSQDIGSSARRGLEIVRDLGRSSTAKYESMKSWAAKDGRVRGGLLYHGASTGRWAGKGPQPQNFPKGTIKATQDDLWDTLMTGGRPLIQAEYGSVLEALSTALRGAIIAKPEHELFVSDFASIEARVLLWLANDQKALQVFRDGRDIYCDFGPSVYGRIITKDDKEERQLCKFAILGLGYGMGASKFQTTCESFGITIDEDFARTIVEAYRTRYGSVKNLWRDQEAAAIQAVESRKRVKAGRISWVMESKFLYAELPSRRRIAYPYPEIKYVTTSWGESKEALTFMGVNSLTRKWVRQSTYGGSLVENACQSTARDIMAEAMKRVEAHGYPVVLTIHDEIVSECPEGVGDVGEFDALMAEPPVWAQDCPIEAAGWKGIRYGKG